MASYETLHRLIHSLSKGEKRYFQLFCQLQAGSKVYLNLYRELERKGNVPEAVAARLLDRHPEAVLEAARKHLYRALMKSLRNYEAEKSVENRLMNRIQDVKILFSKGLMEGCFTELEKAKAEALRYEKFTCYLILARLELQYLTRLEFADLKESELVSKQERLHEVLHQELWVHRHSTLFEVLSYRYFHSGGVRSQQETDRLNDLLLEEFQVISNKHYHSVGSSVLHLHFQSTYFLMTGNHAESLKLFYQLHRLFEQHPRLVSDAPVYYLYLLNGILTDLRSIGHYEDMVFFVASLQAVVPTSESMTGFVAQLICQHQLARLIGLGEFDQALVLVKEYEQRGLNKATASPPNAEATLQLLIALVYFGLGDFNASLRYVNGVVNRPPRYISRHVYVLGRLFRLVLQYELANYDYLAYEIRSLERKLKAEKQFFQVEKLTIHFLKRGLGTHHSHQQLAKYHQALSQLFLDPYERQLLAWFDMLGWVEAKMNKIPFAQLIREKKRTKR